MSHYTEIDVEETEKQPTVCKYCGKRLKTTTSLNQGCGDICRLRYFSTRCRKITIQEVPVDVRYNRFKKSGE